MARWRAETKQDVKNFDGCGFGKYCYILLGPTSLVSLKPTHNLLVRGSNPCGGTKYLVSLPRFTVHEVSLHNASHARWREDLAIHPVLISQPLDSRVMRSGPLAVADGSALVNTLAQVGSRKRILVDHFAAG
jgi:hypothetical protein